MSKRSKYDDSAWLYVMGAIGVLVLVGAVLGVWVWEVHQMVPHTYVDPSNTNWYHGLIHGLFAIPNFLYMLFWGDNTVSIFQNGADGWYTIWFLLGVGSFAGAGSKQL